MRKGTKEVRSRGRHEEGQGTKALRPRGRHEEGQGTKALRARRRHEGARGEGPVLSEGGKRTRVEGDLQTRERLVESAATLFAANGYAKVTVRDICTAAGANVAAINYHFGGKTGLYEQVLRRAITVMQATTHEAVAAGADRHPREQLKAYLSIFMRRVFAGRDSWIHQMMMRELADPTPALDLVVEEVMKPRMQYLARVVGALLDAPPTDARVRLCAVSVQAQCLAVLRSGFSDRLDMVRVDERSIDDVAEHIARFSLGGIRAVAGA